MEPNSAAAIPREARDGAEASRPEPDGLVHRRRHSDWTGEPRPCDEAAESAYRAALGIATATLAAYDGGTASHCDDVVTLCLALADELGVEDRQRNYLLAAAELHDIGKVAVPARILSKPAPLDDREWEVVREHTVTGQRILASVPELVEVARIVRHCHERFDGDGYPDGLAGQQIPLAARIVFCADAFHAIRADRPYRRGRSARAALAEVEQHSGTQFDPAVVEALTRVAGRMRRRKGLGAAVIGGGRRSQRLAALLLTLAIGGSAFAASGVWRPGGSEASTKADDGESRRVQPAADDGGATGANGRARRAARAAAGAAARSGKRPAANAAEPGAAGPPSHGSGGRATLSRPREVAADIQPQGDPTPPRRTPAGSGRGSPAPPAGAPVRREPRLKARPAPAPRVPAARPPPAARPVPAPPAEQEDDDGDDLGNGNGHGKGRGKGHGEG